MDNSITTLRLATELFLPWLQLLTLALIARELKRKNKR